MPLTSFPFFAFSGMLVLRERKHTFSDFDSVSASLASTSDAFRFLSYHQ